VESEVASAATTLTAALPADDAVAHAAESAMEEALLQVAPVDIAETADVQVFQCPGSSLAPQEGQNMSPLDTGAGPTTTTTISLNAANTLFSVGGHLTPNSQDSDVRKATICRHFLQGGCFRRDCWYSHDFNARLCKFWALGSCVKGSACPFIHGTDGVAEQLMQRATSAAAASAPAPPRDAGPGHAVLSQDEAQFPALGGAPRNAMPAQPEQGAGAPGYTLDFWNQPVAYNVMARPDAPSVPRGPLGSSPPVPAARLMGADGPPAEGAGRMPGPPARVVGVDWVSTGDNVASLYAKHRQDANYLALARNKLFQRWASCFEYVVAWIKLMQVYCNTEPRKPSCPATSRQPSPFPCKPRC
jgi:hypothetical protein